MSETVDACPECGTTSAIYSRNASENARPTYRCRECGAVFETPEQRETDTTTDTQNGLARTLADAKPEDYGL